jgi:hypothetical protein
MWLVKFTNAWSAQFQTYIGPGKVEEVRMLAKNAGWMVPSTKARPSIAQLEKIFGIRCAHWIGQL